MIRPFEGFSSLHHLRIRRHVCRPAGRHAAFVLANEWQIPEETITGGLIRSEGLGSYSPLAVCARCIRMQPFRIRREHDVRRHLLLHTSGCAKQGSLPICYPPFTSGAGS